MTDQQGNLEVVASEQSSHRSPSAPLSIQDAVKSVNASTLRPPVHARDQAIGSDAAPVTLLEYGDFECPASRDAFWVVQSLRAQMGDRLRLVFRHFPLTGIHAHAQLAAEAAEAAGAQDKFWLMHSCLYALKPALTEAGLVQCAADIGLDGIAFLRAIAERLYAPQVQEDIAEGIASGVTATPTFFINGVRYTKAPDMHSLEKAINAASEPVS